MRLFNTWSKIWMPVMPGSPVCSYYETVKVYPVAWAFSSGDTPGRLVWVLEKPLAETEG